MIAHKLNTKAKLILDEFQNGKDMDMNDDIHYNIYSVDGSLLFVNSYRNVTSDDGMEPNEDEQDLFQRMKNEKTIHVNYDIDDYMHVICASKVQNAKYCVIAFAFL